MSRIALASAGLLSALSTVLPGQARPPAPEPGSQLTVYLVTFGTGPAPWERYGHNAIWIHDAGRGTDSTYDYGRFSFQAAHFFLRFAQGKMRYSMGNDDATRYLGYYARMGRTIWVQELDLTPATRLRLLDFLQWNLREENRSYDYDYYRDNCSTRIRDALDAAAGGVIRRYAQRPSGWTYRGETRRANQHNVLLYTGFMLALGQPVDRPISIWEQMFLPLRLREHLDSVRVTGPDGQARPLVKATRLLARDDRYAVPERPSPWAPRFWVVGGLLGAAFALLGRLGLRRAFLLLGTAWALLAGVAGLALAALWGLTQHVVAYRNENLLQVNLLALALALVLPTAARGGPRATSAAKWLATGATGLALLGLALKLLPGFYQSNYDIIGLTLPVHLGMWLGVRSIPVTPHQ